MNEAILDNRKYRAFSWRPHILVLQNNTIFFSIRTQPKREISLFEKTANTAPPRCVKTLYCH